MIKKNLYQKDFVEKFTEGFDEFARDMEPYTPAWAEEKTSVPQGVIADLALEMAAAAPRSLIHVGYHGAMGTQYKNSLQLVRAVACVNGLLGNYNQLGGLFEPPKVKLGKLNPDNFPTPPKAEGPMVDGSADPSVTSPHGPRLVSGHPGVGNRRQAGRFPGTTIPCDQPEPREVIRVTGSWSFW
jgi:thiosulfate reductase/polysulfide reductase chain A